MNKQPNLRYKPLAAAVALGLLGVTTQSAMAQQQPAQRQAEEVVVTGSYLERPADRPQPITILSNEEITLGQKQSIAEVFKDMPQVQATSAILNYNENYTSPTMTANLRGLGARATLVLMNGRRQTVDGNEGTGGVVAVDINNLSPAIMIDRIEVLTDGASALYGSDAVAGVVNVITRNDFEGFELQTEYQSIDQIGTNDYDIGAIFGSQSGDTGVVAAFEWSHSEAMTVMDRFTEERVQMHSLPSSYANPGSFFVIGNPTAIPDPNCGSDLIGGGISAGFIGTSTTTCQTSLGNGRSLAPDEEHLQGLAVATHDFGGGVTAQLEVGFARARYDIIFGYGLPILPPKPVVPANNPGVLAAAAADPMWCGPDAYAAGGDSCIQPYQINTRTFSPAGDPPIHVFQEQDTVRVAGTLSGEFGESAWGWDATVTFSQNDSFSIGGDAIRTRFQYALDGLGGPFCDQANGTPGSGDCLYYNPFSNRLLAQPGDAEYVDRTVQDWFFARSTTNGSAELETLDFVVTGELGELAGGPTGLAIGVQTRSQEFGKDFDPITEDGGYSFNQNPSQDYYGVRDTDALFAELVLFPTDSVEIQLAARYEDYGTVDSTDPKIGFLWTPTENLFFRATAGTSFRQPGEVQSFGVATQGSSLFPLGGETINARGVLQGNPNLKPETSDNFTVGMTWDITDNFTMDLNYYSIEFNDLIVAEDGGVVLLNDIQDGNIDDPRIHLFPNSPTEVCEVTRGWVDVPTSGPLPADCVRGTDIFLVTRLYINQDFQKQSGIDFNFDYRFSGGGSDWGIRLNGTYVDKFELISEGQVFDAVGSYNGTNFGLPNAQLRANLVLDWMRGNHRARATLHHTSKVEEDDPTRIGITVPETYETLDFVYDYALPSGRSSFTVGILNATDELAPLRHRSSYTTESYVYDPRGRMFRVGFNWNL